MQFVQFFQIRDCRDLQETEIISAGVTKIGDIAMKGGTPAIALADTAVSEQVVPPGERACSFYGLRSHGHLPKVRERLTSRFVPRISLGQCCFVAALQSVDARAMSVLRSATS
jgi:hypothetical protein